jgi:hypothetical protein
MIASPRPSSNIGRLGSAQPVLPIRPIDWLKIKNPNSPTLLRIEEVTN